MISFYLAALEHPEDEAAFVELYHKNLTKLTKVACRYFNDKWFVEDALQMTWESVARNYTKIVSIPRDEIEPYLVTITANKCRDILRKEKKYVELFPDENMTQGNDLDNLLILSDSYSDIVMLIRSLPEIYREVLERRLVLEESNREIAKSMEISEALAAQRFLRGKALLTNFLKKEVSVNDGY